MFTGATDGNGPEAIGVDPFGAFTLVVDNASNEVAVGIPGTGFVGTVGTGASPVAITIDPSSQFVYVANSGDGTVSGYSLSLASPYLTPLAGSPWTVGTNPSALVPDPLGQYLYVANTGSSSISGFTIDPLTGALSPIAITASVTSPNALAVSNSGSELYVSFKSANTIAAFCINTGGALSPCGSASVGTTPTSITTVGTYK